MAWSGSWNPDDARSWKREFPRLPALAALRTFEAAARHESFSRAASELFVTHGAVSHQIRALEEELGQPLFERRGKRVVLTTSGRLYAERVRDALLQIADATRVLQSSGDLRAVQEMLGHASVSTTQVYTSLDFQHLAKVYDQAHPRAGRGGRKKSTSAPKADTSSDEEGSKD